MKARSHVLLLMASMLFVVMGCSDNSAVPVSPTDKFAVVAKSGAITSTTGFSMIDLGEGCAYGINSMGKAVGVVWIQPEGYPHAYVWFKPNEGNDLGYLGYPEFSCANDINDLGQVVGFGNVPGTMRSRGFLWSNRSGMVDLGILGETGRPPEDAFSYAFGINNKGEIVGEVDCYAFLWANKRGMVLLNTQEPLWKRWNTAWDINDYGLIVGSSGDINDSEEERVYRAKLWTNLGEVVDLGTILGRQYSVALGVNNKGEIVGGCNNITENPRERIGNGFDPSNVAFIWTKQNKISQLPALVGGNAGIASANAINDLGQVVGWSYTAEGKVHAVVWTSKNGIHDLGTLLTDDVESVAYGINNLGQVVGYSQSANRYPHAVIWTVK
jgi:probable HAF family extracellular repeat protein